ncbi:MAG: hypothetical protein KDJ90_06815 [Nitratireductor sp.]|nr:hypothetical protein [Nitratireductor sp.]
MSRSALAAVHLAMNPDQTGAEAEADAPKTERETSMTNKPDQPSGDTVAKADHDAAVAAAETKGRDEGAKAANDRLGAILGAEGIKGDGPRMAAALDLAMKSPDMKAEDVTAFVTGNLPAASAPDKETDADQYERDRVAAAGLSAPVAPDRQQKKGGLSGLVDAHVARVNAS